MEGGLGLLPLLRRQVQACEELLGNPDFVWSDDPVRFAERPHHGEGRVDEPDLRLTQPPAHHGSREGTQQVAHDAPDEEPRNIAEPKPHERTDEDDEAHTYRWRRDAEQGHYHHLPRLAPA